MSDIRLQDPLRNSLDDIIEQAQQDLDLERKRQESIVTAEEPDTVLSGLSKIEKQIENEPEEVQRSVLEKAYSPGYFDRGVRGGNISRPMQEYSPVKNQQEKRQPISESMYNALAGGSAKLGADLASSVGFIYGLASTPQRIFANIPGLEFLDDGTREMEEFLTLNPVAKYYKEQADYHREQNTRYDQGITDYLQEGNFMDAIGLTAVSIVESLPYTASIMAGGASGMSAKTMIPLITASTGGGKSADLMQNVPKMTDNKRILNALTDGLAEGAWEQFGTVGIGRTLKQIRSSLTKSLGREKGEEVLKDATAKVFEDKLSRFIVSKSALKEGATELATTVTQNLNAMVSGEDPNRELFEGAIDAFIVGAGSGGALSAPTAIQVRGQRKELEAQQERASELQDRVNNIETDQDVRRLASELNIEQQQREGTDFVGKLIDKAQKESGVTIEREFLDRTMADEIQDEQLSDERVQEILTDHGISEDANPEDLMVVGRTSDGVIRISTAGTPDRIADEFVAVQEEMAEVYYNAETENNPDFEQEVEQDRKAYYEATGEQDTGESNQEWFSSKAVQFATQGKVHESIGARLRDVFDRFIAQARKILRDSFQLRKAIREGKVPESLIKKLEQATDFKTVGKKAKQADTSKEKTSYRISEKQGSELVWKNIPLKKQPNLLELTKYFTSKAQEASKKLGVDLTENTPEALDIISNVIAEEINIETGNEQNALGWYSVKMQNAIELLGQIHPELINNDEHNQVFKIALAITSNGAPVEDNLKNAVSAYEYWRENNSLPTNFKQGGKEAPAMATAFKLYNKLVSDSGVDAVHSFINTQFTVKEIKDMGYPVNGELVTEKVMGAVIFGPKVGGGFLSNLNGHYEYLTMDRWFMRTIGRIRGNLKDNKDYTNQLKRFKTALRVNPTKMKEYGITKEQLSNDEAVIEVARKVLKDYAKKKLVKKDNKYRTFYPKTKLNKASNTLVKVIDSIHEAPANGTERKFLREIMEKAVDKSNIDGLTMADAQAIIWFPEKRIFSNFGVGSQRGKKETDYEIEARRYVKQRIGRVQPIGSSTVGERTAQRESAKDQQDDQNLGNQEKTNQEVKPSFRITEIAEKSVVTPLAKVYQEQKGNKKSYTKKDFEKDLARLGYDDDMIKSAMDMFGIIRMKEIETTDPTPIEKELKKLQEREIKKNEVKSRIQRAYKLGVREKEKEITKLQKIVTNYARQNLPKGLYQKSEVTGILAKVRDAKRFRQLSTAMERIDRVIDKVSKRGALAKFNKTIKKKAIVKKVGGVPKGQVGAEVQEIVNDIRSVYKLSEAEVENRLELLLDIIDKSADGQPTDLQSMQMHNLMTYGAIKSKTPQQIVTATQSFDLLVTDGRMQIMEENQAYKTRMASVREEILNIVTGGAGAQTQQGEQALGLKPKDWSEFRKMISQFDNNSQSLEYIFDKLSRLDKTSSPLQSFLNNYFMPQIRQARLAEYGGTTEMITMMKNKLEEIYGLKGGKLRRKLNENIQNTITITHHDKISPEGIKGDIVESTFTYNQAYKKWMELKDATLHKTFVKMGYDVNKVINQIEQQLPKEVIAWAEWQLYEFYPMYYQRVNETFRRRFFVNLPFNPMYSPIKRLIGAKSDTADPTLDKKKTPFGSVQNGSMKSRVGSQEELAWVDGDTILLGHVAEMEHFIAYTDVLRELRSVFMSRDISRSIQQFHGKPILRVLNKFIDDIARGGIDKSNSVEGIDYLRGNFSRSAIGLNPVVFLKQLGSIPAYASDMPMSYWLAQFTLLSNPITGISEVRKMLKTLSESKLLDMRYEVGMERDIALAMRSVKPGNVFTGTDMLNNIAYLLTKLGDKTAIYLGGYPLYKYEYKQAKKNGATDEEAKKIAMKKFEASTLRAQQSGEIEDLSEVQRSGTYAKLFTMFMTSPNQYYRMSIGGWRNLKERRGTKAENIRRIFIAQFVLPTLFTYIANGFEYDEEDHITSLILFPFAGIMFFGQAFQTVIDRLGGKNYGSAGEVSILEPFNDIGRLASRIRQIQLGKKDLDSKQVLLMVNDLVIAMSRVLGLPYTGVKRSVLGAIKVVKGEAQNPVRETIGFKPKKKEKKKPIRSTAEPIFRP